MRLPAETKLPPLHACELIAECTHVREVDQNQEAQIVVRRLCHLMVHLLACTVHCCGIIPSQMCRLRA